MTEAELDKAWEIETAWENRAWEDSERSGERLYQMHEMWEEREGDYAYNDYLHSTYRNEALPLELSRFLRNDGVADWYEICVLKE